MAIDALWLIETLARSIVTNVWAERWFYLVMGASLAAAFAWDAYRGRDLAARYGSASVRTDLVYAAVTMSHILPFLILAPLSHAINTSLGLPWLRPASLGIPVWAQLIGALLYRDFCAYAYHRAQHRFSVLWQAHKVHHSVTDMTVLTTFRFTLPDLLVETLIFVPVVAITGSVELPFALMILNLVRSSVQHSDTGWTFGWIGHLIVSPAFHETHHSIAPEHRDRNFGVMFPFWDHLFGTYARRTPDQLTYGVAGEGIPEGFVRQMAVPIIGWWRLATASRAAPAPRTTFEERAQV